MIKRIIQLFILSCCLASYCVADEDVEQLARKVLELVKKGEFERVVENFKPRKNRDFNRDIEIMKEELSNLPPLPNEFVISVKENDIGKYFVVENWSPKKLRFMSYLSMENGGSMNKHHQI